MSAHEDWTYDNTQNFIDLPNIVADLHNNGQHYINIIGNHEYIDLLIAKSRVVQIFDLFFIIFD